MKKILLMFLLFFAAVAARAAENPLMKKFDANGDKKLSWDEIKTNGWSQDMFSKLDLSKDGFLDKVELSKMPGADKFGKFMPKSKKKE